MACENCKTLESKLDAIRKLEATLDVIRNALNMETLTVQRRRRFTEEVFTPWGRLIAAAATSMGTSLAEISEELGHGRDYLARIARGDLTLIRPAARQIGARLGIDLMRYVGSRRGHDTSIPQSVSGELPGVTVPVAPGVNLTMGGEGAATAGAGEAVAS